MKLLWIVGFVLPDAAKEMDMKKIPFGGWVSEMIRELSKVDYIELAVAMKSPIKELKKIKVGSIVYYYLPQNSKDHFDIYTKDAIYVLNDFSPDLLHAEGTEQSYTNTFLNNWTGNNVVSLQGIINAYEPYEYGGLSLIEIIFTGSFLDFVFVWALFINKKMNFKNRLKKEIESIRKAKNIFGRTTWDRAHSYFYNKHATYFSIPRTLRPSFYKKDWQIKDIERYSIFIGNAASPRKGGHFVIKAISILKKEFPNIKLYIAGSKPQKTSLLEWKKMIGYPAFLIRLIKKYKVEKHIVFTGILDEVEIANVLSKRHVYVMASVIENSPNTLGEAMMIGVPSVASYNGGVPDMALDNIEVLFYRDNDPFMLAYKIRSIFLSDEKALELSRNSKLRASKTHDRKRNTKLLLDAYNTIMK